jgi:hypothetical protein
METISRYTNDEISHYGILQVNSPDEFYFAHRTFAEYFFAQYLTDRVDEIDRNKKDGEVFLVLLCSTLFNVFIVVKSFLIDFSSTSNHNSTFFSYWQENHNKIVEFSGETKQLDFYDAIVFANYFPDFSCGFESIVCVYPYMHEIYENQEKFINIFGREMLRSALKARNLGTIPSILNCIVRQDAYVSRYIFKYSLRLIDIYLTPSEVSTMFFLHDDVTNLIPMMQASWKLPLDKLTHLWQFAENFTMKTLRKNELEQLVTIVDENEYTILHYAARNEFSDSFILTTRIYSQLLPPNKIKEILLKTRPSNRIFIYDVIENASHQTSQKVAEYLFILFTNDKLKLREFLSKKNEQGLSWINDHYRKEDKVKIFTNLLRKTFEENEEREFENLVEDLRKRSF